MGRVYNFSAGPAVLPEEVLKEAQRLGFAEANPSADIDGYDIMRKICILASIAFKTPVKEEDVQKYIDTWRSSLYNLTNHYIKFGLKFVW